MLSFYRTITTIAMFNTSDLMLIIVMIFFFKKLLVGNLVYSTYFWRSSQIGKVPLGPTRGASLAQVSTHSGLPYALSAPSHHAPRSVLTTAWENVPHRHTPLLSSVSQPSGKFRGRAETSCYDFPLKLDTFSGTEIGTTTLKCKLAHQIFNA